MSQVQPSADKEPSTAGLQASVKSYVNGLGDLNPWHNIKLFGRNVRADILAGLTVAVISIPMALAFGVASGLGAHTGVWGTVCGGLFVGVFGGCPTGISGPTSPKVVQIAAVMSSHKLPDGSPDLIFAAGMIFLSGVILLIGGLTRIGRFIYYTPYSVVSGFMCAIGVILILLQVNPMLGLPTLDSIQEAIIELPDSLMNMHLNALLVSGTTFGSILLWARYTPIRGVPGPLVGLFVGTTLANVLGLDVPYLNMKEGLPDLYWPSAAQWAAMFPAMIGPAFALAGLAAFDSLLTCLVADTMTDDRHDSNRELFGQGIANMACGVVGGVTTATATMRTVANIQCGARSGLACLTMGAVMLALMLGLAPLASYVPMACLGGILLKVGIDILDYRVLPVLKKLPLTDMVCFWVVLGLTLWTDLLVAVGTGLVIAFFRFVQEMSDVYAPQVVSLKDSDEPWADEQALPAEFKERVLTLHQEGPLFFGQSDYFYRTMERLVHYDVLIIRMKQIPTIDLSGAYLLEDLVETARKEGTTVLLTGVNANVKQVLMRVNVYQNIGAENFFDSYREAVARAKEMFDNGDVSPAAHTLQPQSSPA